MSCLHAHAVNLDERDVFVLECLLRLAVTNTGIIEEKKQKTEDEMDTIKLTQLVDTVMGHSGACRYAKWIA